MICGQCGDLLVKVPVIRPTQIFALIAAAAFMAPLLVLVIAFIKDQNRPALKQALPSVKVIKSLSKNK